MFLLIFFLIKSITRLPHPLVFKSKPHKFSFVVPVLLLATTSASYVSLKLIHFFSRRAKYFVTWPCDLISKLLLLHDKCRWYFARSGIICAILKTWKAPIQECYFYWSCRLTPLYGDFRRFSNCTNATKSRKASHIEEVISVNMNIVNIFNVIFLMPQLHWLLH